MPKTTQILEAEMAAEAAAKAETWVGSFEVHLVNGKIELDNVYLRDHAPDGGIRKARPAPKMLTDDFRRPKSYHKHKHEEIKVQSIHYFQGDCFEAGGVWYW